MVVLATDAPLSPRQLERLCVRAMAGLARTGSQFEHGSGDFVIAFSTAYRILQQPAKLKMAVELLAQESQALNGLFRATAQAVEEAVINSLCAAKTMVGRDGHIAYGLPLEQLVEVL